MNMITTLGALAKQVVVKKIKRKFATFDFMSSVCFVVLYKAMQTLDRGAMLDSLFLSLFCNNIVCLEHFIFFAVREIRGLCGVDFSKIQKTKYKRKETKSCCFTVDGEVGIQVCMN